MKRDGRDVYKGTYAQDAERYRKGAWQCSRRLTLLSRFLPHYELLLLLLRFSDNLKRSHSPKKLGSTVPSR